MLRLELLKGAKGVISTLAPAAITILIAMAMTFTSCQKEGFKDLTTLTLEEMENTEFMRGECGGGSGDDFGDVELSRRGG